MRRNSVLALVCLVLLAGQTMAAPTADSVNVVEIRVGNQFMGVATDTSTDFSDNMLLAFPATDDMVWILDIIAMSLAPATSDAVWSALTFKSGTTDSTGNVIFSTVPGDSTGAEFINFDGRIACAPDSGLYISFSTTSAADSTAQAVLSYSVRQVSAHYAEALILDGN